MAQFRQQSSHGRPLLAALTVAPGLFGHHIFPTPAIPAGDVDPADMPQHTDSTASQIEPRGAGFGDPNVADREIMAERIGWIESDQPSCSLAHHAGIKR